MGSAAPWHYCHMASTAIKISSVQKSFNKAGQRLLALGRPACKADPWLASRNLDFEGCVRFPRETKPIGYVYVYIHIQIYVHICIHIYTYMYIHILTYVHICVYKYLYTFVY